MFKTAFLSAVSAVALLAPFGAKAANQPATRSESSIEEVTVTAERRSASVQKTAIAITALDADFLKRTKTESLEDVANFVPGLTFDRTSNFVQLSIRGIGLSQYNLGGEPGVAIYVDGVYLARPFALDAVLDDLARVEVLRGPQGTLYGRNATGGAINLISNAPTSDVEGSLGVTVGNYGALETQGVLSGPLNSDGSLRGRITFVTDEHDGYTENLYTGKDIQNLREGSGRGQLVDDVTSNFTVSLAADYTHEHDSGPIFKPGTISPYPLPGAVPGTVFPQGFAPFLGGQTSPNPWQVYLDGPQDYEFTGEGGSVKAVWDMGWATLTSLTAYRSTKFHLLGDLDGTDIFFLNEDLAERAQQTSEEIQLASKDGGPLSWIIGGFAYHENGYLDYLFDVALFGGTLHDLATQRTTSYAGFGEANYNITDALKATVGLRYSVDEKSLNESSDLLGTTGYNTVNANWGAFTPKFVLSYDLDPDKMLYVSATRGFKSGGFNIGALQNTAYNPEYVWSYEAGLKSRWFDGRLQANLDAFYYDYSNLQVTQYFVGKTIITNAASAQADGVEAEIIAIPIDNLTLNMSLGYMDATFTNFSEVDSLRPLLGTLNLDGNSLPRAPKLKTELGAQYDWPLANGDALSARYDYSYQSKLYFTEFNTPYAASGSYSLSDARVSYETGDGHWEFAVFGKNLFNKAVLTNVTVSAVNGGTIESYGNPRTYGVQIKYNF
jgi:iron complex outermembrane receptor protein